jgi:hypothetical protein
MQNHEGVLLSGVKKISLINFNLLNWQITEIGPICGDHGEEPLSCVLGNSGKPVTLETLGLTKFSNHVFQEQGIHDFRKPGTCEASNSWMCRIRESWFGEEVESWTCGSPESRTVDGPNFEERPIRESVEGW